LKIRGVKNYLRKGWNSSLTEAENQALQRGKIVTNPE
jgi:hypothetical protein